VAAINVSEILSTPFSVWQVDFTNIVSGTAQQAILLDPAGIVHQFTDGTVYLFNQYATSFGSATGDVAHPLLVSTIGASGILNVNFLAAVAKTNLVLRVLFLILSQSNGFQPPFQTK
jgi:hypothetical protein